MKEKGIIATTGGRMKTMVFLAVAAIAAGMIRSASANEPTKEQRFAKALQDAGISADEALLFPMGRLSENQVREFRTSGWSNITEELVSQKRLPRGETTPSKHVVPQIIDEMRKLEQAKDWPRRSQR